MPSSMLAAETAPIALLPSFWSEIRNMPLLWLRKL
jgi:hypothetical protein